MTPFKNENFATFTFVVKDMFNLQSKDFLTNYSCSRDRYITHFYCLAVEAGFYSDVVECLPLDPAAQVRFPPRAVGIFLHPVTFGSQYVGSTACVSGITQ